MKAKRVGFIMPWPPRPLAPSGQQVRRGIPPGVRKQLIAHPKRRPICPVCGEPNPPPTAA